MRAIVATVLTLSAVLATTCTRPVPKPRGVPAGTPFVSWVFMSGDRDNADREFVCQSDPRTDCVVEASRPDAPVFSDVHFYYHGAGGDTKYQGTINIGFFEGAAASHTIPSNVVVRKGESIVNQSVTGVVTLTPGTYDVTIALTATMDGGKDQPIRQSVPLVVK
jgi:hypothetical protein